MRGGGAGYGAGSFFLMDFNLLWHLKLSSRLLIDHDLHFVQCYICGNTPTFCVHVIVSNLLWFIRVIIANVAWEWELNTTGMCGSIPLECGAPECAANFFSVVKCALKMAAVVTHFGSIKRLDKFWWDIRWRCCFCSLVRWLLAIVIIFNCSNVNAYPAGSGTLIRGPWSIRPG